MKILVGSFQCESNTFSAAKAGRDSFYILHGEEAKKKLFASHLFEEAGFEVVPLVYAVSLPSGMVTRECFDEIMADFRSEAAKHLDAAGVYLYLHGAMFVEGLGSGEEWTVKELRKTVGDDIPITLALDFHANISGGLVPLVQGIAGYRTAPHTDYDDTERRAAEALIRLLSSTHPLTHSPTPPVPHFFRIKVQFADAAQTSVEPYVSIMKMVRELDTDPDVVSCSVFNGQPWVDAPCMSASVIVYSKANHEKVHAKAKAIADYYEEHKTDLKFGVPALAPDKTVEGIKLLAKPVFISDSGDNTTAGAGGESAYLLRIFLESRQLTANNQRPTTLFTSLYCPTAWAQLEKMKPGERATLTILRSDDYTDDLTIEGEYVKKGRILGFVGEESGEGIIFRVGSVDIVFASVRTSFTMKEHFAAMGVSASDYEAVIVKQGYLWPGAAELAASQVFCMTPGTATNDFSTLPFKNLEGDYYYVKPNEARSNQVFNRNEKKGSKLMNLKKVTGLMSAFVCGSLMAGDVLDLSSSDVWSDKTAIKELLTANSAYTALQDFGYSGRLYLEANNIVVDMTEESSGSANRTISPTRSSLAVLLYNGSKANARRSLFKGGIWDFGTVGGFNIGNGVTYNGTLVLTNQCVFKDVKGVYFQGSANGSNELVVAGQSRLNLSAGDGATTSIFQLSDISVTDTSTQADKVNNLCNTLRICEGSTVAVDGAFFVEAGHVYTTELAGNNSVIVSGAGSSFSVLPTCTDKTVRYTSTGRSRGNRVLFTDHAQGRFQHYLYHGDEAYASDNLFTIEKGASVSLEGLGYLVIGNGTSKNTEKNTVLVREGGSLSCGTVFVGGPAGVPGRYAELIVDNATFSCNSMQLGNGASNRIEVCGSDAHFNAGTDASANVFGIFAAGGYNELVIRDQAVWSPTRKVRFCADYGFSSNNVITVTKGAKIDAALDFMIAGADWNIPAQTGWCQSNRLAISDAAEFNTDGSLIFSSNDNGLHVSNATVSAAAFALSNSNRSRIELKGSSPRIRVTGAMPLVKGAKLHFDIPDAGYDESFVPVTASSLTLDSTTELRVSVSEQFLKDNLKRRSIPLAVAMTLTVNADVLAAANANLPPKCSISVVTQADGKKALCLSVPGNGGLMMLLR